MDLNINAKEVAISPNSQRLITVQLDGVDENDIFNHFNKVDAFIEFFGEAAFLDAIGQDKCESYFDLKPNE